MKRVGNKFKGTQKEKQEYMEFCKNFAIDGKAVVVSQVQHAAAEQMVKAGHAVITKKKNYGRIAEIELSEELKRIA